MYLAVGDVGIAPCYEPRPIMAPDAIQRKIPGDTMVIYHKNHNYTVGANCVRPQVCSGYRAGD